jgi:hypothetical protein
MDPECQETAKPNTVRYRVAKNEWNLRNRPWDGAIGIEEVEFWPDGSEVMTVPSLICWFSRGCEGLARRTVSLLNIQRVKP